MKELSPKRDVFRSLSKIATEGTHIVCLCKTQRHITAYMGALVLATLENSTTDYNVEHNELVTIMHIGEGAIFFICEPDYDAEQFVIAHKAVRFI